MKLKVPTLILGTYSRHAAVNMIAYFNQFMCLATFQKEHTDESSTMLKDLIAVTHPLCLAMALRHQQLFYDTSWTGPQDIALNDFLDRTLVLYDPGYDRDPAKKVFGDALVRILNLTTEQFKERQELWFPTDAASSNDVPPFASSSGDASTTTQVRI